MTTYEKLGRMIGDYSFHLSQIRIQQYGAAWNWEKTLLPKLTVLIDEIYGILKDEFPIGDMIGLLKEMEEAKEREDEIWYGDLVELKMIPFLKNCAGALRSVQAIWDFNENYERNLKIVKEKYPAIFRELQKAAEQGEDIVWKRQYLLEDTEAAVPTLAVKNGEEATYVHSNVNPIKEAYDFARSKYETTKLEYGIVGIGLGYVPWCFQHFWNFPIELHIYETELGMIWAALHTTIMTELLENAYVHLYYDKGFCRLADAASKMKERKYIYFYPGTKGIKDEELRKRCRLLCTKESSYDKDKALLYANFIRNTHCCKRSVEQLRYLFEDRYVYVVAAGPSLDKNLHLLKEKPDNSTIIVVGTAYHKVKNMGIDPDCVIVSDANLEQWQKVSGIQKEEEKMLLLSTADFEVGKNCGGDCYLVYQEGYEPARKVAAEKGYMLFETGGSVSTTALDVALRLGAERVIMLGLDLAYTGQKAHADGTAFADMGQIQNKVYTDGWYNEKVLTSDVFLLYKEWFEKRLRSEKSGKVINATEGGAYICGMEHKSLQEVLKGN